jgi:hypothetical protein
VTKKTIETYDDKVKDNTIKCVRIPSEKSTEAETKNKTTLKAVTTTSKPKSTDVFTKVTYVFPTPEDGKNCHNKFRVPRNHNPDKADPHMRRTDKKEYFKPGSYITFECKPGFRVFSNLTLVTYCTADGNWSPVADCDDKPPTASSKSINTNIYFALFLFMIQYLNTIKL